MSATPEKFVAANKVAVESLLSVANTALASAERLAALNLNTARSSLEDGVASVQALFAIKDPQQFVAAQAAMVKPNVEKLVSYTRSVYEIAAQAQESFGKLVEAQFASFQKDVSALIEQTASKAPAGSEVAIAAVRSAFAAANSSFESMNAAAKQVVELAESNVNAATTASVKAVTATTAAKKKAA